ncbi:hypothetical protein GCK72_021432 [Caenorhabditis remanei]|uniref:F-box domain-containing protein n=1 Tax=Caenorhabditis remanei TaxID=31234 RepID=A0A6A5GI50_CAERE|nr:hypothetical protein GCK72_021432 [Caenorhabditis remanei]KAF1754867.1 hypothetical protein GCK72_021432 [Caenorhabditis remanei]
MFDRLINVLESRDRLLQVKSLMISVHGQDQLRQLLRHVDLKVLKSLEVFRLLEIEELSDNGDDNSEFVLDLDILKECEYLEELHVKGFSISSPFHATLESSVVEELSESPIKHEAFILNMPDLVMREILKNLNFLSIQKLRNVCHALREFIDYSKPDNKLIDIEISVREDDIMPIARFTSDSRPYNNSETTVLYYIKHSDRCVVRGNTTSWKKKIIEKNFIDVYTDDFLVPILKKQKSPLPRFGFGLGYNPNGHRELVLAITFKEAFDRVIKVLESRRRPLQVENLQVYVVNNYQLIELLRCVDMKSLKRRKTHIDKMSRFFKISLITRSGMFKMKASCSVGDSGLDNSDAESALGDISATEDDSNAVFREDEQQKKNLKSDIWE